MRDIEHHWEEESAEFNCCPPEMREKLTTLQSKLESFRRRIEQCPKNSTEFIKAMSEFWAFLSMFYEEDTGGELYQAFERSNYFAKHQKEFSGFETFYVRSNEIQEAMSIKYEKNAHGEKGFLELCDTELSRQTYEQTRDEMQMLDEQDRNCETMVMVGCGPLPETMMFIIEQTGVKKIIGLDQEETAVSMAGGLIHSMGYDKRIDTQPVRGEQYNYGDADVICVANFVSPKRAVFERIADTAKQGAKILTRNPVSFGRMLYEVTEDCIPPRLTIMKKDLVNPYFLFQGMLLEKAAIEI
jgi:hypothetical protein